MFKNYAEELAAKQEQENKKKKPQMERIELTPEMKKMIESWKKKNGQVENK